MIEKVVDPRNPRKQAGNARGSHYIQWKIRAEIGSGSESAIDVLEACRIGMSYVSSHVQSPPIFCPMYLSRNQSKADMLRNLNDKNTKREEEGSSWRLYM